MWYDSSNAMGREVSFSIGTPLDGYQVSACESLRGLTTGYAVPIYAINTASGGGGKIPLGPTYVRGYRNATMTLRDDCRKIYDYHEPGGEGSAS